MGPSHTVEVISLLLIASIDALEIRPGEQNRIQFGEANKLASAGHANHGEDGALRYHVGDGFENMTDLIAVPRKRIIGLPGIKPKKLKPKIKPIPAQPTGGPSKKKTAAEIAGVEENAAGDLNTFLNALIINAVLIVVFFLLASILRRRYPIVYSWNSEGTEEDPERWSRYCNRSTDSAFFGWWTMSASVELDSNVCITDADADTEERKKALVKKRGLDIIMLLQFCEDAKYILSRVGLPLLLFVSPQHAFLGGNRAQNDYLSHLGMANVVDKHPFLYWEHAIFTWIVVVFVERQIFACYRNFKAKRIDWLMTMPTPRSTTVLVESIPSVPSENKNTQIFQKNDIFPNDKKLEEFMNKIFARGKEAKDVIKNVEVVKNTKKLLEKISERDKQKDLFDQEVHKLEEMKKSDPPTDSTTISGQEQAEQKAAETLLETLKDIDETRDQIIKDASEENSQVNLSAAFVTFHSRRDAELAKQMIFTSHADEYEVDVPPEPSDVIYADLQRDPDAQRVRDILGYCLIAGVFWAYVPTIVTITYYASIETLAKRFPMFESAAASPEFAAVWDGLVCSQVLTQVMGFVPTFFGLIFKFFFILKAQAWVQYRIQFWYFYFQVIFILLVTTVGSSLFKLVHEIGADPGHIFYLLASNLPQASHFYLNFLPAQWVAHATNLMRIGNFFKFKMWSIVYGEDKGKDKSEPEDQDYYGLGSRSARFTFMLVLSLSFCLLSPLITALGWVNFWICRKVYGYLCVYAETKKPDLGGVFYMAMLSHVQEAMFIFIILMSGVLTMRDDSWWPGAIAGSALAFQAYYYKKFVVSLRWESLSFEEMMTYDEKQEHHEDVDYVQPELRKQDHEDFLPKRFLKLGV